MPRGPSLAYVIDPRFPGGTSAAVAAELAALAPHAEIEVCGVLGRMFPDRPVAPVLAQALEDLRLPLKTDPAKIAAPTVVLHNPSFLRFDAAFAPRILAGDLHVVMHENPLRPGGHPAFDMAHCLRLIDRASLALRKWLVPVSPYNRAVTADWLAGQPEFGHWRIAGADWHNICDFPMVPPNPAPRDRRGRHSRPGFEKFPGPDALDLCFPVHAEANVILGADSLIGEGKGRPHWTMIPFQGIDLASYFAMIDVMVYFTAPTWRESFGRVLAEATAAGKLVVADPETAALFGGGVVGCRPDEVNGAIARLLADPAGYARRILTAQARLADFSSAAFLASNAGRLGLALDAAA